MKKLYKLVELLLNNKINYSTLFFKNSAIIIVNKCIEFDCKVRPLLRHLGIENISDNVIEKKYTINIKLKK